MPRYSCGKYTALMFYTKFRPDYYRFHAGVFQTDEYEGEERAALEERLDAMEEVTKDVADAGEFECPKGCNKRFTSMAAMYGHSGFCKG